MLSTRNCQYLKNTSIDKTTIVPAHITVRACRGRAAILRAQMNIPAQIKNGNAAYVHVHDA